MPMEKFKRVGQGESNAHTLPNRQLLPAGATTFAETTIKTTRILYEKLKFLCRSLCLREPQHQNSATASKKVLEAVGRTLAGTFAGVARKMFGRAGA